MTKIHDRKIEIITLSSHGRSLEGPLIPGEGDVFEFLEDAKFVWVYDGNLHMVMVDYKEIHSAPKNYVLQMIEIAQGNNQLVKKKALQELLQSDPLIAQGSWPMLTTPRFSIRLERRAASGRIHESVEGTRSTEVLREISRSETLVEQYTPGWLSIAGFGETRDGESRVTTGTDEFTEVGTTTGQKAFLDLSLPEDYAPEVIVWFDDQYGTFLVPQKTYHRPPGVVGGSGSAS